MNPKYHIIKALDKEFDLVLFSKHTRENANGYNYWLYIVSCQHNGRSFKFTIPGEITDYDPRGSFTKEIVLRGFYKHILTALRASMTISEFMEDTYLLGMESLKTFVEKYNQTQIAERDFFNVGVPLHELESLSGYLQQEHQL